MEAKIKGAIEAALKEIGIEPVAFVVEHPADLTHGDYASNVALVAAKQAGANPRELAEKLATALEGSIPEASDISIAGPGFINFSLTREYFKEQISTIVDDQNNWGKNADWEGKTSIIEYTDPNPFKELHIGHLVPNALGESLARLFEMSGANTKRVTFQGDVGMHVAKALYGIMEMNPEKGGVTASMLGEAYAKGAAAFEESDEVKEKVKALNKSIYLRDNEAVNELYDEGKKVSIAYFEEAFTILGSDFDHYFFESVTGPVGLEIVKQHIGDIFEESDGAVIFRGEEHGLHTRVFINNEGLPTYESKDIGLIKCKEDWEPFDLAITVTGTEQEEYFKVTTKASELIQPELAGKVELVPNGMLQLSTGKMSSRTGNVVRALALIDEVKTEALKRMDEREVANKEAVAQMIAVGAIKYTILKIAAGKDIVFDLEKSISFEGDSGPYLQYTYARIQSLIEKANAAGIVASVEVVPEEAYPVEKIVYQLPEVVTRATEERAPHHVVGYLTELAGAFNSFYGNEKIVDVEDQYAPYKLAVALAVAATLKNGLYALGIEAPEAM